MIIILTSYYKKLSIAFCLDFKLGVISYALKSSII